LPGAGKEKMKLAVVCCLHGTEPYGLEVVKRLPASIPYFIGNKKALKENKRFIETDLNRSFPGSPNGNHEEKLAYSLNQKLKDFDYILDIHSSSNECPLFGIITNLNREKVEFARRLGLRRLVKMAPQIAGGKALIDYVKCGISLEIGPHQRKENAEEVIRAIMNLINNVNYSQNLAIYEIFSLIKKEREKILIKNFEEVKKGQVIAEDSAGQQIAEEGYISVLVNERAYSGILCLAARTPTIFINPNY